MPTFENEGDTLIGYKIVCEARKINGPDIINKSGRHKAQRVTLKDNAKCIIIKKAKFVSRNPNSK